MTDPLHSNNPVRQHPCHHGLVATFLRLHPYYARLGKVNHLLHRADWIPSDHLPDRVTPP